MAYLLIAILPVPVCTEPNISCSHDSIHHRLCEMAGEEGGEVEEEGGWGGWEGEGSSVYHSVSQYTTAFPEWCGLPLVQRKEGGRIEEKEEREGEEKEGEREG